VIIGCESFIIEWGEREDYNMEGKNGSQKIDRGRNDWAIIFSQPRRQAIVLIHGLAKKKRAPYPGPFNVVSCGLVSIEN
jgi:hypothetical protein